MSRLKKKNAIILAAGFGLRMVPINRETPKALLEVDGVPLIERLIMQLLEVGVSEIFVVVGFLKDLFTYLEGKYPVTLVPNEAYADKNNLHSLALVANEISCTYILSSDIMIQDQLLPRDSDHSWYMVYERENVELEEKPYWDSMTGVAYISDDKADRIRHLLDEWNQLDQYKNSFWEEVLYEDGNFIIETRQVTSEEIYQVNTFEDLLFLDSQSVHLNSQEIDIICETFKVQREDISSIQALKKGMTNRSFTFCCLGKTYIMRIPGEGTDQLINRQQEADVYEAISKYRLSDRVLYMNPKNGYKITEFLANSRNCDAYNLSDIKMCMKVLKKFHDLGLEVNHEFQIFKQIQFYETLRENEPSMYETYNEVKERVFSLEGFISEQVSKKVLTHIDAVADNFLIIEDKNQATIRLIDWEYAGMQDPHVDIAMFAIYALYNQEQIDQLISCYFDKEVSEATRMKIYAYVATCGLLWSNWCEFKRKRGIEFGEYAYAQYKYAETYSQLVYDYLRGERNEIKL